MQEGVGGGVYLLEGVCLWEERSVGGIDDCERWMAVRGCDVAW